MNNLYLDFETYSAADLPNVGLDNYAAHPSTGAHCLAFAFDAEAVDIITDNRLPDRVAEHVKTGGTVVAHNAAFEWAVWNQVGVPRYGWPPLTIEQMRCTMVQAFAMGLPGALADAAAAVGIEQRKDSVGARVMMQLAKPKLDGTFWRPEDSPDKFAALYDYCKQDVEVERALDARMRPLSGQEQNLWVLDQKINQRGVAVDLHAIGQALALVEAEKARLDKDMLHITGGVVGKCTEVQLLVRWIKSRGVEINGVAKADVLNSLQGELPSDVRAALELRKEAAKSSTAKLVAMKNRASRDGRVRGTLQFHGANTGRWAGRGIQVQNFPRPRKDTKQKHVEDTIAHLHQRDYINLMHGPVLDAVADSLRGFICAAPGKIFVAADFSSIEARVLAWLAGEEKVLEIFRTHGLIYEHAAAEIYSKKIDEVTKEERQIGKVAVLALGYGGGVGAFQALARGYGVAIADEKAEEIKKAWRDKHRHIVRYWRDLETAAINAVELGGVCGAGPEGRRVAFVKKGSFLWCRLPSGRVLCYPYPQIKPVETPWGELRNALVFMSVNGVTKKWEETKTYGGSLAENLTQAVARDLLAEALVRLENQGFPVVMHIHDEAVMEIDENSKDAVPQVEQIMTQVPFWAKGLPIKADGWQGKRFKK